jgi:aspartate/methionine/tyrosine aminotransferase
MNEIARQLNNVLERTVAGSLLSSRGKRMYFPRGIVSQSAEAKKQAHSLNATAGIAASGGQPLHLSPIRDYIPKLSPEEIFSYAPTAGHPQLRKMWLQEMVGKNPSLRGKMTSLPVVVGGLTHGLTILADLFVDPGDTVVVPDLYWGNYSLIFIDRMEADFRTFSLFSDSGALNCDGLADLLSSLETSGGAKVVLLLNFPNNPSGYSPNEAEAAQLFDVLAQAADKGTRLLLICDDAYFGLFYEPDIYPQSIFADAADLHENILAAKVDGATKENLVWGFRVGFLTVASKGLRKSEEAHEALVQKMMGLVRSSVSSCSILSQNLLLKGMRSPAYEGEKQRVKAILEHRYRRSREILSSLEDPLRVMPFNSGYFLCFDTGAVSAEGLRKKLLADCGIGTISIQDRYLRVAYSSVDEERLEELYAAIMDCARQLLS